MISCNCGDFSYPTIRRGLAPCLSALRSPSFPPTLPSKKRQFWRQVARSSKFVFRWLTFQKVDFELEAFLWKLSEFCCQIFLISFWKLKLSWVQATDVSLKMNLFCAFLSFCYMVCYFWIKKWKSPDAHGSIKPVSAWKKFNVYLILAQSSRVCHQRRDTNFKGETHWYFWVWIWNQISTFHRSHILWEKELVTPVFFFGNYINIFVAGSFLAIPYQCWIKN